MKKIFLPLMLILSLFIQGLQAQNSLSGRLSSGSGGKLPANVNISLKNGPGATSGEDGKYIITGIPDGKHEVTFSFVGYSSETISISLKGGQKKTLDVVLFPSNKELDETVITATRHESPLYETPARIHVITPKQINMLPARTADDYLNAVPGVQVDRPFGIFSTKSSVTMRGMNGKEQSRVLVMSDGVPLNKSDGGSVNWNLINPEDIERIEVVKGPVSSLYGGNAMGGAINIVTHVPVRTLEGKVFFDYGTYNTLGMRGSFGGKLSPFGNKKSFVYYGINGFYRKSDGYITQSEADRKANPYITKSNVDEKGGGFKLGTVINEKQTLEISFSGFDDLRGTGEVVYMEEGNTTEHDSWLGKIRYKGRFGKTDLNISLFTYQEDYKKVNEYMKDDYTLYKVLSERTDYGFFSSLTLPVGGKHKFTGGIDMKQGAVDASDVYYTSTDIVDNAGKMDNAGLFLQDELFLIQDKLKLVAGFRFDYARFYDGTFVIHDPTAETVFMDEFQVKNKEGDPWIAVSPKLSVQYKPAEGLRYFASYAKGFRASVLDDLCRSGRIRGGFKIANPGLQPEYINTFELGGEYVLIKNLEVTASAYYSLGRDFLYYVNRGDSLDMGFGPRPVFVRKNISGVRIAGAEAGINYAFPYDIKLGLSYTFCDARITDYVPLSANDPVNLDGNYLTDVPAHSALAKVTWSPRWMQASLLARYLGSRWVNDLNAWDEIVLDSKYPGYLTLDARIQKDFYRHLHAGLEVQNILDQKFYDSKGAVCPGRFITATLGMRF